VLLARLYGSGDGGELVKGGLEVFDDLAGDHLRR
jgi:hypothetical protein